MRSFAFKQVLIGSGLFFAISTSYAFHWQQLWATPNQQAAKLMQQSNFAGAKALFEHQAWRATAAFRAKDYQQAALDFEALHSGMGYYNQGNALAHLQRYEQAIKAYDLALSINPDNQDAKYNRELVASLLKQQQESNKQQNNSSKPDKDKQQGSDQDNSSNLQQNKAADKSSSSDNQTANKPDSNQQQKQANAKPQDKTDEKTAPTSKSLSETGSAEAREQQQAKEQWLRLIPDDPGGLLREKFLRDYIRRQRGWYQ